MLLELKNLLETSDSEGVRRQARGTLEALGVEVKAAMRPSTSVKISNNSASLSQPAAMSAGVGLY